MWESASLNPFPSDSIPGKIPWRRKWQPTPVFLPGKSHGQREEPGRIHSPWGHRESSQRVRHDLVTKYHQHTLPAHLRKSYQIRYHRCNCTSIITEYDHQWWGVMARASRELDSKSSDNTDIFMKCKFPWGGTVFSHLCNAPPMVLSFLIWK